MKFELGQLVATPGALAALTRAETLLALKRHSEGDWGDVGPEDKETNNQALLEGNRLLSSYRTEAGERFWIITEWDRSVTTVLLPDEY